MSAHTPAPWELRQSANGYWFIDYEQGGEGYTLTKLECGERDARLIAAAPDLLAALELIEAKSDYGKDNPKRQTAVLFDILEIARAAITKATGGAA